MAPIVSNPLAAAALRLLLSKHTGLIYFYVQIHTMSALVELAFSADEVVLLHDCPGSSQRR